MSNEKPPFNESILLQEGEIYLKWKKFARKAYLILTNQRFLYVRKVGFLAKDFSVLYGIYLEDIMSVSHQKVGLNDRLVILEKSGKTWWCFKRKIHSLIPDINKAILERKKDLKSQRRKDNLQIILDFTSLNDVMKKGGLTMQVLKCPECHGKLDFPKSGSQIECSYCGTNILAEDIFEKVRNLLE